MSPSAPWYAKFNGERRNDHHTTLAEKHAARVGARYGGEMNTPARCADRVRCAKLPNTIRALKRRPRRCCGATRTGIFFRFFPPFAARCQTSSLLALYDPSHRQGPAIWLRAALGRAIPDRELGSRCASDSLPSRRRARDAARSGRLPAAPAASRLVRGRRRAFGHANSKDWTLRGFLSSKPAYGGLGLDVAQDDATRDALAAAAPKLFELPLSELQGRRLDAPWLLTLLAPDLADDTLAWLGGVLTAETDPPRFAAFQARAKAELKVDPAKFSPAMAAARVLRRENGWGRVWDRFAKSGRGMYERAAACLAQVDPPDPLLANPSIYATVNAAPGDGAPLRACQAQECRRSDRTDGDRTVGPRARRTLLSALGRRAVKRVSPWRCSISRVSPWSPRCRHRTRRRSLINYAETGWEADDAALRVLEAVAAMQRADNIATLQEDREAVVAALRALYAPRLEREALALQALLPAGPPPSLNPEDADTVLFIDGLRMDVAHRLAGLLDDKGAEVKLGWRWTGFPSVTATCKPLASPAASRLHGARDRRRIRAAGAGRQTRHPRRSDARTCRPWLAD